MTDDASVTRWIDGLKLGDEADIQRLWDRYFERLVRLAGKRLPEHARRELDEEDVALSAFQSFCARVEQGQFPRLADRDDLWKLLVTITVRKVVSTIRHTTRQKRGGGHVAGESAFPEEGDGIEQIIGREPTPEFAARFAEAYDRLLARLDNPTLKTIALRKLEGYSSEEIAAELKTSARTVDRKLQLIRALWEEDQGEGGPG